MIEDGETGAEYWRDVRPILKARKRARQSLMPKFVGRLMGSGYRVERFDEHHFRVWSASGIPFDYWPSTGKWKPSGAGYLIKFGFMELMNVLADKVEVRP